jgi:two-component system, LytTR family, response regulator
MKTRRAAQSAGQPLHILIVDDEPLARRRLRELLADEPDITVVGECGNGREAVTLIRRDPPDVVLLDIQMPELDGFGVLRAVGPERMPAVIFVTASDAHAVHAFEVHAADYLLKPVDQNRLLEAIRRAKGRTSAGGDDEDTRARLAALLAEVSTAVAKTKSSPASIKNARIPVKGEGRVLLVRAGDIDWVEAMDNYVRLHVGRDTHVMRETLSNLEERLQPPTFLRIHRSTIVNVEQVREIQPWFAGDYVLILLDGTKLTTGRRYRAAVQSLLGR